MSFRQPKTSEFAGVAAAASSMLALTFATSKLVILWCPRGEDCHETAQALYGLGLIVSLVVAIAVGFIVRDLTDSRGAKPPR